jgi:hypothetical protein
VRRFLESLSGKLVCHAVAVALVMPFVVLASVRQAQAQGGIANDPQWAVLDFVDKSNSSKRANTNLGADAADRLLEELTKSIDTVRGANKYGVIPRDQVSRAIETLGLQNPVVDRTSQIRLAQELSASRMVVGEIANWGVHNVPGGKQAVVAITIRILDASSGISINGADGKGTSSVRSASVDDKVILGEATADGFGFEYEVKL